MVKEIQFRRGSTSDHISGVGFTGALAEVTVDTTNNTLRVHDGSKKGGHELVGVAATQRLTNKDIEATTFSVGIATITSATITNLSSSNLLVSTASTIGSAYASSLQVTNDVTVGGDLYVTNNVTIGGTATQLNTQQLLISDPDIVLGIGTTFTSTDLTANHGGIAVASDEGTPLVNLNIVPGEINPSTYKKIMWFKGSTLGAGITDAWLSNYAVGVGTTQVPNNVSFDAGGQFRVKTDGAAVLGKLYDSIDQVGTASSILVSTGSVLRWVSNPGITTVTTQVLTSGTTYTPNVNAEYFLVIATGGGAGGGGADGADTASGSGGGGGGAGGTVIKLYNKTEMGASSTYAIGAGGNAGAAANGTSGTAGGNTTFNPAGTGATLTANGGALGTGGAAPAVGTAVRGGVGGSASGGDMNIPGGDGGDGVGDDVGEMGIGGVGGASFWGGGGSSGAAEGAGATAGTSSNTYGGGGGGAGCVDNTAGAAGGAGFQGVIFVLEFRTGGNLL